jgi:hypothetical protein
VVIRGSSQGAELPGREADHFTCGVAFKCRLARYLTKSKPSIFLFFWWGDALSPCTCDLQWALCPHTIPHRLLWERTRYAVIRSRRLISQGQCIVCLLAVSCTVAGSVFACVTCNVETRNTLQATVTYLVPGGHLHYYYQHHPGRKLSQLEHVLLRLARVCYACTVHSSHYRC